VGSIPTRPRQFIVHPLSPAVPVSGVHYPELPPFHPGVNMRERIPRGFRYFILFMIILLTALSGCVSNVLLLETRANDPIMMNLLDNDLDLTQVEDGTGFIGESTACPT
jgi:hypothetical protein